MGTTSHHASVLAIDTATNLCSIALVNDADIKEIQRDLPRAHNQHILAMVDELLEGQSLSEAVSVIACGVGPGSFTGIRVAVGVAQGLGWSLDLPIYPFCSLEAQARATAHSSGDLVLSAIDAQIGQVYWAWFRSDGTTLRPLTEPAVSKVTDLTGPAGEALDALEATSVVIAGDGAELITAEYSDGTFVRIDPEARPRPSLAALHLLDVPDASLLTQAHLLEPRYVQQDIGWKKLSEQGKRH
ncbi:MAG: tRNA (adenosine(37)-N6)-threonylcarbamoyltransferase complex dimerization subunit type 1 TsaB [Luminiphilus sp.]|jgi:tRNA threonylcarbamoyladenosine biosynthesis protein TsaB